MRITFQRVEDNQPLLKLLRRHGFKRAGKPGAWGISPYLHYKFCRGADSWGTLDVWEDGVWHYRELETVYFRQGTIRTLADVDALLANSRAGTALLRTRKLSALLLLLRT